MMVQNAHCWLMFSSIKKKKSSPFFFQLWTVSITSVPALFYCLSKTCAVHQPCNKFCVQSIRDFYCWVLVLKLESIVSQFTTSHSSRTVMWRHYCHRKSYTDTCVSCTHVPSTCWRWRHWCKQQQQSRDQMVDVETVMTGLLDEIPALRRRRMPLLITLSVIFFILGLPQVCQVFPRGKPQRDIAASLQRPCCETWTSAVFETSVYVRTCTCNVQHTHE